GVFQALRDGLIQPPDLLDDIVQNDDPKIVAAQLALQQARHRADVPEGIANLVRQTGSHVAQRRQAILEPLLLLPQLDGRQIFEEEDGRVPAAVDSPDVGDAPPDDPLGPTGSFQVELEATGGVLHPERVEEYPADFGVIGEQLADGYFFGHLFGEVEDLSG